MIAQVVVDAAHLRAKDSYDYLVPDHLNISKGSRVEVPFGRTKKQGFVLSFAEESEINSSRLRSIESVLDSFPVLSDEAIDLAQYLAQNYHMPLAQAVRVLLPAKLRDRTGTQKSIRYAELAVKGEALAAAEASMLKKDGTVRYAQQLDILNTLKNAPRGVPAHELPASSLKTLLRKEYVRIRREDDQSALVPVVPAAQPIELAPQQKAATEEILGATKGEFLLHGVTGSGKTEVYIQVVLEVLSRGQGAIILVPEIALTPQIYEHLSARLGEPVALFHSKLTDAQRLAQWKLVRSGQVRVVLGPRSAVFAPVENLGAIIVDEEQESSYKSGRYPGYTAKEIARFRAERNDAFLVLGSATPSMESYQEAIDGKLQLVRMPHRLFGAGLPSVEIIDMRREVKDGNPGIISAKLDDAIRTALADGKQTMILLNRRGYSSFLMCTSCGTAVGCDNCDVSMTYHKSEGMLKCHYCGARHPVPDRCPTCGADHLRQIGIGTQKLEEELHKLYPSARILRMDADTMSGRTSHQEAYNSFRAGEADILIGTQMIAKGFDFDRVSVAAVLAADTMLHLPDYRSAERAFDQITQLAGRAGRRSDGRVYVQTYSPDHYAVRFSAEHDFSGFFFAESSYRKNLFLPPYGEHIVIRFASEREAFAQRAAKDFFERMRIGLQGFRDNIIKARASEAPIRRIQNAYRYQILLHLREQDSAVEEALYNLLQEVQYDNVLTGIDINPAEMY